MSHGHEHSALESGRYEIASKQEGADATHELTQTLSPAKQPGTTLAPLVQLDSPGASVRVPANGGNIARPQLSSFSHPHQSSRPQMSGPGRSQSYTRQGEDILGPPMYSQAGQQSSSSYVLPQDTSRGGGMSNSPSATGLPGALQAGRPAPTSMNPTPSAVPILPPLSTQSQQYTSSSRASTSSHSHNYSRSSPAAPYAEDSTKYASPEIHKYVSAQTPQTATYSPLGLADIRPRAGSGHSDGPASANPYQSLQSEPTNCNYLAPWAVYSFDWCKWPVQKQGPNDSSGKMAIGSYLEDGHNYVSKHCRGCAASH